MLRLAMQAATGRVKRIVQTFNRRRPRVGGFCLLNEHAHASVPGSGPQIRHKLPASAIDIDDLTDPGAIAERVPAPQIRKKNVEHFTETCETSHLRKSIAETTNPILFRLPKQPMTKKRVATERELEHARQAVAAREGVLKSKGTEPQKDTVWRKLDANVRKIDARLRAIGTIEERERDLEARRSGAPEESNESAE